jgi:hypothetical protein
MMVKHRLAQVSLHSYICAKHLEKIEVFVHVYHSTKSVDVISSELTNLKKVSLHDCHTLHENYWYCNIFLDTTSIYLPFSKLQIHKKPKTFD